MQRLSSVDRQSPPAPPPPLPPPHICDRLQTSLTPIPSRLERLQRKASEKWYRPLRLSSKRGSQQYQRPNATTNTVSINKGKHVISPAPSSSTHLPNKGFSRTDEIKRSRSFAYGSHISNNNIPATTILSPARTASSVSSSVTSNIYPALLSRVAYELQSGIILGDRFKNGIEYKNAFDGQEAVDQLTRIIATNDRFLALIVGRALGSQRFFHDVSYENRLVDSAEELYQFDESIFLNKTTPSSLQHEDSMQDDSPTAFSPGTTTASNSSVSDFYVQHSDVISHLAISFPSGIITELTYCYSPTCYGSSPCYSYSCPKRQSFQHQVTVGHLTQLLQPQDHPLWADLVSETEYSAISSTERKRQEGIYELIYTEVNYVKDLEYLEEMWIRPLTETDIIPESRRLAFVDAVFSNLLSIYAINIRLVTALLKRQKQKLVVYAVGDIMLDFVVDFEPYIKYGARQHEAKYALEKERCNNPALDWFINDTEQHPASHKLELNGYLTKPTTRMGKYLLLLHEILKRTPEDHPDRVDIPRAISIIKQFLTRVNSQAGATKNRFDLERIHAHLVFKNKADSMDLGLLKENRVIIKQGTLRKTPNSDSTEYQVILFDHYLVVAKVKMGRGGVLKYVIQKRPMALDLLTVFVLKELKEYSSTNHLANYQQQRQSGSSNSNAAGGQTVTDTSTVATKRSSSHSTYSLSTALSPTYSARPNSILPYVHVNSTNSPVLLRPFNDPTYYMQRSNMKPSSINMTPTTIIHDRERKVGYPIVFDYLGRRNHSDVLILYATSDATRKPWVDKITKQQNERRQRNDPIFEVIAAVEPGHFDLSIRINHMVTFNSGHQYVLAADDGVYVGHTTGKKTPHKVLNLIKVTQIQVLEPAQMLLVLSDRILYEYALDVVNGKPESQPPGKRVQSHVPFFHVGFSMHRTLVCVPRVSTLKSTITTFEPIGNLMVVSSNDLSNSTNEKRNDIISNKNSTNNNNNNRDHTGDDTTRPSTDYLRRRSMGLLDRMALLRVGTQQLPDIRLRRVKTFYVPCEVWAIELSPSKMLITSPRGMILVDMKTDKPQQLLDPDDKCLTFVTEREREDSSHIRQPMKHIAIFRTPRGDHFVCYDEYGFYIDGKGNRLYPNFLVEWEGNPDAFACFYPYIIAFESSFIEIRHIITGELEQIIRGTNIRCLNNGHQAENPLIFGVLTDEQQQQSTVFQLKMTTKSKLTTTFNQPLSSTSHS